MPDSNTLRPLSNARSTPHGGAALPVTPELVRAVADRVYAMLQRDARLEHERLRDVQRYLTGQKARPW